MVMATQDKPAVKGVPLFRKRLQMPDLMRKLADKSLLLDKTTRTTRDALRISHGETIGALASGIALVAGDYKESIIRTTQVAVMTAFSWITSDPSVDRCSLLVPKALEATKYDPFCESLYKSVVPYKAQTRTDSEFTLWSPSLDLIDAVSSQARDCGIPMKWFVQVYTCGVIAEYGEPILGRYAKFLKDEYEFGRRWVEYREKHVLTVIVEDSRVP